MKAFLTIYFFIDSNNNYNHMYNVCAYMPIYWHESMREYAHFHITVVKKITILGPFFGLFLIYF